jgi:hypothetical protein
MESVIEESNPYNLFHSTLVGISVLAVPTHLTNSLSPVKLSIIKLLLEFILAGLIIKSSTIKPNSALFLSFAAVTQAFKDFVNDFAGSVSNLNSGAPNQFCNLASQTVFTA